MESSSQNLTIFSVMWVFYFPTEMYRNGCNRTSPALRSSRTKPSNLLCSVDTVRFHRDLFTSHFEPWNPYTYKLQLTENLRHSITNITLLIVPLKKNIVICCENCWRNRVKTNMWIKYKVPMTTAL